MIKVMWMWPHYYNILLNWMHSEDERDKGMIRIGAEQNRTAWTFIMLLCMGFNFKTILFYFWGIFQLIFLDHGWQRVTETVESKTVNKVGQLYINLIYVNIK